MFAETPYWIKLDSKPFTGQSDYILFDPKGDGGKGVIYVADFKPDYSSSYAGSYNFINAVPQIACYALLLQKETGLKVKCLIFNADSAMEFDPNKVLTGPHGINKFMEDNIENWKNPWESFSRYLVI